MKTRRSRIRLPFVLEAFLRAVSLLVPGPVREEWLAEWTSELWYVTRNPGASPSAFCFGALPDALWARVHHAGRAAFWLAASRSPLYCLTVAGLLAGISLVLAFRLPGPRGVIVGLWRAGDPRLAVLSSGSPAGGRAPEFSAAEFALVAKSAARLFDRAAFYRPVRLRVLAPGDREVELAAVAGEGSLFEFPDGAGCRAVPSRDEIVLSRAAWRRIFGETPPAAGRILEAGVRRAAVAAVVPDDCWTLPGEAEAWLLESGAGPATGSGFLAVRLKAAPLDPLRSVRWTVSLEKEGGGLARYEIETLSRRSLLLVHAFVLLLALLILPAASPLSIGTQRAGPRLPWLVRCRWWIFLTLKLLLLPVAVFCGALDLAALTATELQPHAFLAGYVLAFRWALADQRKRCPVCLARLSNPTHIGWVSRTFLDWYGTELMCTKGHGLMHVPEVAACGYTAPRWLPLDSSWAGLFGPSKAGTPSRL
jgi:hypothetical protein